MAVTGVYLYSPVAGSRPSIFHRYCFAPSLLYMLSAQRSLPFFKHGIIHVICPKGPFIFDAGNDAQN